MTSVVTAALAHASAAFFMEFDGLHAILVLNTARTWGHAWAFNLISSG